MKSSSNRPVVDRKWLSGVESGQEVSFQIHSGGIRSPVESRGHATITRAGKRYLEVSGVFDGQISRDSGRASDGRGRTIVIAEITPAHAGASS